MSTRLMFDGLAQLRDALRNLPEELAEARQIVESNAEAAAHEIQGNYPVGRTGKLRGGVSESNEPSTRFGVYALVKSKARHAHLFEFGTGRRQTAKGANRGQMPAGPAGERMLPVVIRRRRIMTQQLIDLVRRAGFVVETRE